MKIVLATHNPDKQKEMFPLLKSLNVDLFTLEDFPEIGEIVESGTTLQENALIKARTVHELTDLPTIADDTGLEVDALNGTPGVYSARYAGDNPSYEENVLKLLSALRDIPQNKCTAQFRTVIAFVDSQRELIAEGIVKGLIIKKIKGVGGFGYDPVFYIPEKNKTFAEMTLQEKSKISHRGKALRQMRSLLKKHLSPLNQINPRKIEETA